jgi:DNA polymerase (family 10)
VQEPADRPTLDSPQVLSNAEIAEQLASLAQLLSSQKENPYKTKAYRRAAARIRNLSESLDELVRDDADLTRFPGIGEAIAGAIREIVLTGTLGKLEKLRTESSPALASISDYPRLDPKTVLRVYKKLGIASITELRERLETGELQRVFGLRTTQRPGAAGRSGKDFDPELPSVAETFAALQALMSGRWLSWSTC